MMVKVQLKFVVLPVPVRLLRADCCSARGRFGCISRSRKQQNPGTYPQGSWFMKGIPFIFEIRMDQRTLCWGFRIICPGVSWNFLMYPLFDTRHVKSADGRPTVRSRASKHCLVMGRCLKPKGGNVSPNGCPAETDDLGFSITTIIHWRSILHFSRSAYYFACMQYALLLYLPVFQII